MCEPAHASKNLKFEKSSSGAISSAICEEATYHASVCGGARFKKSQSADIAIDYVEFDKGLYQSTKLLLL